MGAVVSIQGRQMERMEYRGFPVVTLKQIDNLHGRTKNAERNFIRNRKHFIDGSDFFHIKGNDAASFRQFVGIKIPARGILLFTESGYLMIAKSFTDDLSWKVQRELVNHYFRGKASAVVHQSDIHHEVKALREEMQELRQLVKVVAKPARMKTHPVKPENRNFLYNRFLELYNGEMSLRTWKEMTGCPLHASVLASALYQDMLPGERGLVILMKYLKFTPQEIKAKLVELGKARGLAELLG